MISTTIRYKHEGESIERVFRSFFKFQGYTLPVEDTAAYIASILIARVRRSYLKQQNADGTKWKMTNDARIRLSGGYTYAEGGAFAPGGWKTGGNILFSSGNLFHSIQLSKISKGVYGILTDVYYASKYMNKTWEIIGSTGEEIDSVAKLVISRLV